LAHMVHLNEIYDDVSVEKLFIAAYNFIDGFR
jgi:hypothetical protein